MTTRKTWVVTVPEGQVVDPGTQVLIEQFGDGPPTIAFRNEDGWQSRPFGSIEETQ